MEKQAGRRVAERPPKQKRSGKKLALIVLLVVVLALGAGYTGLCAAAGGGTLLPNTSIAGVDVGGWAGTRPPPPWRRPCRACSPAQRPVLCDGKTYTVRG